MINSVLDIIQDVNSEILKVYNSNQFDVEIKGDDSEVTKADLVSHRLLTEKLKNLLDIPIMSEEDIPIYEERKQWNEYWLIDPLDGTKDFIAKNDEFTINVALMRNNIPVFGLISIPCLNDIYYAHKGGGAFKNGQKIFNNSRRVDLIGADSNFFSTKQMQDFFKKYNIKKIKKIGSSIKLCHLAEGLIDVYPRLNGTKEWDTAAAHIIANEAGCKLIDVTTKNELTYNKKDYRNNYFIASRNDLEFDI